MVISRSRLGYSFPSRIKKLLTEVSEIILLGKDSLRDYYFSFFLYRLQILLDFSFRKLFFCVTDNSTGFYRFYHIMTMVYQPLLKNCHPNLKFPNLEDLQGPILPQSDYYSNSIISSIVK